MQQIRTLYRMPFPSFRLYLLGQRRGLSAVTIYEITKQAGIEMITIILNHHDKYAEVDMPAMYEELQLALWKLGLDRVPEKYTLQDLEATFRYQSPLVYFVLRLLEGEISLLDAVPPGTRGTVDRVDDMANVHTKWDNGRTLSAIPGVDSFRKLTAQEIQEEQQGMAVLKMEAQSL